MKPTLYMMVGFPASGKSTFAKSLSGDYISSDSIREILYGREDIQGDYRQVFAYVDLATSLSLKADRNVILDCTNLKLSDSQEQLRKYRELADVICVFVDTPLKECKRRNQLRSRHVPEYVYDAMLENFTPPTMEEGFSDLWVI
jgi:predicted kinase